MSVDALIAPTSPERNATLVNTDPVAGSGTDLGAKLLRVPRILLFRTQAIPKLQRAERGSDWRC